MQTTQQLSQHATSSGRATVRAGTAMPDTIATPAAAPPDGQMPEPSRVILGTGARPSRPVTMLAAAAILGALAAAALDACASLPRSTASGAVRVVPMVD